jgi:hypothetical protein
VETRGRTSETLTIHVSQHSRCFFHNIDLHLQDNNVVASEPSETSCRNALFITDPSLDRQGLIDRKGLRTEGTCQWIEKNKTYQAWLEAEPSLLWIYGGPGKGKTMLSIYLTQQLEQKYNGNVIYFFCSSGHQNRNTATAVICTLLWQLIGKQPGLARLVDPYREPLERMQALLSTPGSLWEIFIKCLRSTELEGMYCLIDGLDECEDAAARWLAVQFAALAQNTGRCCLHLLVVSRGMLDFRHVKQIHLDPDNDHNISADIEAFMSERMSELSERLQLSDGFRSILQRELLLKAGGTFLWVGYAMNELLAKETSLEVQEAIDDLPAELPALYGRMLRRILSNKRDTITTILNWVVVAIRPLTLVELSAAVTWQIPENMERLQYTMDHISICEPFISVQNGVVLFVHQSAKEYLLRKGGDGIDIVRGVSTSRADMHMSLAKSCLDALDKYSAFTDYAFDHWAEHLRQCSNSAQADIIENYPFFDVKSEVHEAWWTLYCKQRVMGSFHPGHKCLHPLYLACFLNLVAWAQMLLAKELNPDAREKLMNTRATTHKISPLAFAILGIHGGATVIPVLLANGADPTLPCDELSRSSISLAVSRREMGAAEMLLKSIKARTPSKMISDIAHSDLIWNSIGESDFPVTKLLLDTGASLNAIRGSESMDERTPLNLSIKRDYAAHFKLLLDYGADLDMGYDQSLSSSLLTALMYKRAAMTQTLIERGALPDGMTSITRLLWLCIRTMNMPGVEFALQHGVDPNVVLGGPLGEFTSLHWAVIEWRRRQYHPSTWASYEIITRVLLRHGADPDLRDRRGKTAMDYAGAERSVFELLSRVVRQAEDDRGYSRPDFQLLKTGGTKSKTPSLAWRPGLRRKSSDLA